MFLSDEQMGVVRHGAGANSFEWVQLPVGPQPLPAWCKGLSVSWMMGYGNPPDIRLKTNIDARSWPDQRFAKSGPMYMAKTEDGRAEVFYHGGPVSLTKIRMCRCGDGVLRKRPRYGEEFYRPRPGRICSRPADYEPDFSWEEVDMLATTQQEGFGGDHIHLEMVDGSTIVLRGPWHGGSPPGYMDVAYVDTSRPETQRSMMRYARRGPPQMRGWHRQGGVGGLFITEDLFLRLLARFAPECRCARVVTDGWAHLEPVRGDWDEPKRWVQERERAARRAA